MINPKLYPYWKDTLVPLSSTIKDVIENLDRNSIQIVMVCDASGKLIGTLSDGDIRRGLLSGLSIESSIETVITRNPIFVHYGQSYEEIVELMVKYGVRQIPILDKDNKLLGIYLWDFSIEKVKRGNTIVIMAGGKGLRLRPYTDNCPKPMLLVRGKPMLEHIIDRAKSQGFHKFVIAIHYLGDIIEQYFGNGTKWGVEISYIKETKPLGTAGAISLMRNYPDSPMIITNGDVMTDVQFSDLIDFHEKNMPSATVAVRIHDWQHPFGVIQLDGLKVTGFEEKPVFRNYINAGIYVLSREALELLHEGEHCDMPTLLVRLRECGMQVFAYLVHESWQDIGRPEDLVDINNNH